MSEELITVDFSDESLEDKGDDSKSLALFNPNTIVPVDVFVDRGLDPTLEKIKKEAEACNKDISTPEGRKEIKRLVRRIGSIKAKIDRMGSELKAPLKAQVDVIDAERRRSKIFLEELQEKTEKDLQDWIDTENARTEGHEAAILAYAEAVNFDAPPTSTQIQERIDQLENPAPREWQEFKIRAEGTRATSLETLRQMHTNAVKAEKDAEELEQLRREKAEREKQEREKQIADEAAAAATKAAEEKAEADAKIARDKAEAEQKEKDDAQRKKDQEAQDERDRLKLAAEKAQQDKIDADAKAKKAEDDRIAAEKKAEDDKIASAKKAEDDAEAARVKAAADSKAAAEKAVQDEKDRVAAEQKKKDDAAAAQKVIDDAKAADLQHQTKIKKEIMEDILKLEEWPSGLDTAGVKFILKGISDEKIRHIRIKY